MKRGRDPSEPDVETQLREAFSTDDPEAAWYFDRAEERVVRVCRGATNIPELPASEVEEDDERYVEIPVLTETDEHLWMEQFVEGRPAAVASLLDERQGANRRFAKRLAETDPAAFAEWKAFRAARVADAVAVWRVGLG